ncbi:mechanosensitive ion channel family protein [Rhodohalobacter sp. SW132]|uniref:mechanosensitive ion channel domain-containing protein n=1 Tax=Rhodohalobacter sp. SW132 TaxID=2293433 RepID=UPI000E21DDFB|nr:mechanosensitive ion channel family protein [Rhodohalobacter sp. SW132]REL38959.1 mechanosensitive ion channel family protein [Rhodohalobacter sp. SW132]
MFGTSEINPDAFTFSAPIANLLISTVILFLLVAILRYVTGRFIRRTVPSQDLRRKWIVQSRNGLILLFVLGLIIIWGEELRTLALSVVAIAVALVVATKELILCVSGSVLKSGARSFNIGDRIQIKDFRGDVIDQNLLATTILEVGPGKLTHQRTGRMTVIPNALFVSEPLINESFTHDYVLHVFTVPFKREDDWMKAKEAFHNSAVDHSKEYISEARKYMEKISDQKGLDIPSVEPRVRITVPAPGEIHLVIRIPTKLEERSYIEQAILLDVLGGNDFSKKSENKVE